MGIMTGLCWWPKRSKNIFDKKSEILIKGMLKKALKDITPTNYTMILEKLVDKL